MRVSPGRVSLTKYAPALMLLVLLGIIVWSTLRVGRRGRERRADAERTGRHAGRDDGGPRGS